MKTKGFRRLRRRGRKGGGFEGSKGEEEGGFEGFEGEDEGGFEGFEGEDEGGGGFEGQQETEGVWNLE